MLMICLCYSIYPLKFNLIAIPEAQAFQFCACAEVLALKQQNKSASTAALEP